ncbi:hypothetical protein SAMN05421636_11142 [Pricia antarctica]|uniref:Uncharacterized protein n=1 Tax=Pricia antarctica TaxID=641691 RepID=A0A1G7I7Q7_9FLAO|nr:hypothetical protein [Pricia antarctica]SDF08628.1 hypothetical protein SAMN05421636_11142 [Pricia antarctica]
MNEDLGKERMKASESAPMPTKQKNDGKVRNQTTEVPKNRFPWTTIIVVIAFVVLIAIVVGVLQLGSS